jgi:ferredoxin
MCDGLGACIGHCPEGAITIETREAEPYNESRVMEQAHGQSHQHGHQGGGCPGSRAMVIEKPGNMNDNAPLADQPSELRQWPVQMHLVNPNAQYLRGSDLVLAADCVAFSMGGFHSNHLKGKSLAIACPKLDQGTDSYVEKLTAMIDISKVNTITVMMMEVPCCGGLLQMVRVALANASRKVPVRKMIVGINGEVLQEEWV